jgi:hypothetical protein
MEADWEIEIGADAPVIDAHWSGFVDLRAVPGKAFELPECFGLRGLGTALVRLNTSESQVWTAKCDTWPVVEFDADELNAPRDSALQALACYIDLLPRDSTQWMTLDEAVQWCQRICARLHATPLPCSRADLILRTALVANDGSELGVTAYLTSCGVDHRDAVSRLECALEKLADAVVLRTRGVDPSGETTA